jgi:shikimate kinase
MEQGDLPAIQRLVLVGFMASGKSTVGRELAGRLGWKLLDIDAVITEREGRSIARIFEEHGEAYFRHIEHAVTLEALQRPRVVIATGGGWPVAPGRLEAVEPGTMTVWLKVAIEELEARLASEAGGRPMLGASDRRARIGALLDQRTPYYEKARMAVDGTGSPGSVAERILDIAEGLMAGPERTQTQDPKT